MFTLWTRSSSVARLSLRIRAASIISQRIPASRDFALRREPDSPMSDSCGDKQSTRHGRRRHLVAKVSTAAPNCVIGFSTIELSAPGGLFQLQNMLRRFISTSIVFVSLLMAGSPAFACSTGMAFGDCCDPAHHSPCGDNQNDPRQDSQMVSGCVSVTTGAVARATKTEEQRAVVRFLDSGVPIAPSFSFEPVNTHSQLPHVLNVGSISSGTTTYLKTGRLRL